MRNWRISSVGRASALQAEGHRFEPCILHHAPLAQLVERLTVNQDVDGSSPPVGVIYGKPWRVVRVAEGAAVEML